MRAGAKKTHGDHRNQHFLGALSEKDRGLDHIDIISY